MMVTSRFDVDTEPTLEHGKYLVTVHYRLLGKYDMAEGYSQESANTIQDVAVCGFGSERRLAYHRR